MKKFVLIVNIPLVLQIFENVESGLINDYIEYSFHLLLYIILAMATIGIMLIPVILCYSMVNHFIRMNRYNSKIEIWCQDNNSNYLKSICDEYLKSSTNFFKNFIALVTWNIFSLIYIIVGFDNFSVGLREYFLFPFGVFQSLSENELVYSIYNFHSNWSSMIIIIILTFSFYFLGKSFGRHFAKNKIDKRGLNFSII